MAQAGVNCAQKDVRPVTTRPDSLQDLCIFYCMNNLDTLVASLNSFRDTNEDISSTFSLLLGNRLLEYYLACCIPSDNNRKYIDHLVQNSQLCNQISITRIGLVSPDNIQVLANNSIQKLTLTCFDVDNLMMQAYRVLLENNLPYLTNLNLIEKCDEEVILGLLNLLCGQEYDTNVSSEAEDESENKSAESTCIDSQAMGDTLTELDVVTANTKCHPIQISSLRTKKGIDEGDGEKLVAKLDVVVPNLTSFSYEHVYSSMHPNFEPCRSFGWFYHLISKVLLCNSQLQSFSFVTMISNPIEWFLSRPKLPLLHNLQSLCLSFEYMDYAADSDEIDMPYTDTFFANLPSLRKLRHLDISCGAFDDHDVERYTYNDLHVELFIKAIQQMPQLKSLDISGTNLCTVIGHKSSKGPECCDHCMPGFEGRQFDYLGLYGTDACRHKYIPAVRVSGASSMEQLLVALWSLQHNKIIMTAVLNDIYNWLQSQTVSTKHGFSLIEGMITFLAKLSSFGDSDYIEEKNVSHVLHCLYFVLRNDEVKIYITIKLQRMLMEQILIICHALNVNTSWLSSNQNEKNKIVRIAMLLVGILDLEAVVVYSYRFEQYVQVLVGIFCSPAQQGQKMLSLHLLHSACRVSQEYKAVVGGKLQLIKKLFMLIMDKVAEHDEVDEVLEKLWSIIWTMTDEVPGNCELFVQHGGCQLAKTCVDKYHGSKSLLTKISGAMSNVSENTSLIQWLMTSDLVSMFRGMLLYSEEEDYNVSSHAAGFLVMLASHGPQAWIVADLSREVILEEVDQAIKKWDIHKSKGIKFRSLSPMLSQIENYSTPVSQLWGAWLICNLIITKPKRYCDMLKCEDGLTKVNAVLQHGSLRDEVVTLLEKIRSLTQEYMEHRAHNEQFDDDDD